MPKKLTILGALTAALVFGYLGLFNSTRTTSGAPIQTFLSAGGGAVSIGQCYDTVAANYPVVTGVSTFTIASIDTVVYTADPDGVNPPGTLQAKLKFNVNTTGAHGIATTEVVKLAGSAPAAYNRAATVATFVDADTVSFADANIGDLAPDPGPAVTFGTMSYGSPTGRVECNPLNPATSTLPLGTGIYQWTIVNLPPGNRLTLPAGYTPSGPGQWSSAAIPCTQDANNRCTEVGGAGTTTGTISSKTDIACNQLIDILASGGPGGPASLWPDGSNWTPPTYGRIATAGGATPPGGDPGELFVADPDSYTHAIVPFPDSFTFVQADMSLLPFLFLGGTAAFGITPNAKLATMVYESSYVADLNVSVALLGGSPSSPPNDDLVLCLQSPQDSVAQVDYAVTPSGATRIPRWSVLLSASDLGDGSSSRILDWQCDVFGTPAGTDADTGGGGDCLEDSSATELLDCDPGAGVTLANTTRDCDGDLVPDGVEVFGGSDPNDADSDNDGADDYDELFQITDPAGAGSTDTDGDGQADKQDLVGTNSPFSAYSATCLNPDLGGATCPNGGVPIDLFDATDDNCPNVANGAAEDDQLNTDALWQYHGMGGNTTGLNTSTGDRTNPDEDVLGDACDTDDDNDGIPDVTESVMKIRSWSGNVDDTTAAPPDPEGIADGTTVCASSEAVTTGAGIVHAPVRVMSPVKGDVDFDYVLDGRECNLRSRPDASCRAAGAGCIGGVAEAQNCSSGAVAVDMSALGGCAQPAGVGASCTPGSGTATAVPSPRCTSVSTSIDSDTQGADGLYQPFAAGSHLDIEKFYRTRDIVTGYGTDLDNIDGDADNGENDGDSDRDTRGFTGASAGLKDGIEVKFYGTDPSNTDTDKDGCEDGDEVTDINGDGGQNPADSGLRSAATGGHDVSPANGMIDPARYSLGTNRDFNKDGTNNPADAGILAAAVAVGASCGASTETGTASSKATRHLP